MGVKLAAYSNIPYLNDVSFVICKIDFLLALITFMFRNELSFII